MTKMQLLSVFQLAVQTRGMLTGLHVGFLHILRLPELCEKHTTLGKKWF